MRRESKRIKIGNLYVGGNEKIAIQSMTNTPAGNYELLKDQTSRLVKAGCDILRISAPDMNEAKNI